MRKKVQHKYKFSFRPMLLPKPKGPGIILVFAPIDRMVRVSLRLVAQDIPPQDVITRDNVSVKVNAVLNNKEFREIRVSLSARSIRPYLAAVPDRLAILIAMRNAGVNTTARNRCPFNY